MTKTNSEIRNDEETLIKSIHTDIMFFKTFDEENQICIYFNRFGNILRYNSKHGGELSIYFIRKQGIDNNISICRNMKFVKTPFNKLNIGDIAYIGDMVDGSLNNEENYIFKAPNIIDTDKTDHNIGVCINNNVIGLCYRSIDLEQMVYKVTEN